ncbi:hypothetical protein JOQ06_016056 [Pogonophryne albipinna]|uniref:Sushi domain-containing protein n=1 Tax=Pogonophryne albipinna TaxID=1090488 RepID=A0AAD6AMI8_9TELE|nr:hypothetical protein JOQ06_016056 [Pogonophryne albipinna]
MLDRCNKTLLPLFFGCLSCLVGTSVVNADGRVFVLDLRNSSGLQGFRDAEGACAARHARLASAEELHHAVEECFFSPCTRGMTVCNVVGSALKAVDVRTENATEDSENLDAFCIKDRDVPCGDPPSFPNAHLQEHSGYEMGDELLYTCLPGHVMPSGRRVFSLLCDSCGEWYGLVEICVKDETESHVDYEDKFPDSYGEAEHHSERPEEAQGQVYEEVHGAEYPQGERRQVQQETSFNVEVEEEHQDQHGVPEVEEEVIDTTFVVVGGEKVTEAPVSLLSQKHLFWFPSEAFQDEGRPASTNPVTQTTQRASGAQSEESKEQDSQETHHHQPPVDVDDHGHDDHDDLDNHDDGEQSHREEDDGDDHVKHYIPAKVDDQDRRDRHKDTDDHDDHYDMGEHEDDRDRVRYGGQEYDDTYDEHESYEEHEDVTDDREDNDRERPDESKEHPDPDESDDREEPYDPEEEDIDRNTDHNDHDEHDDHDAHDDHDDHDDHDNHDDHEPDDHEHDVHDHDDHEPDDHEHDVHDYNDHEHDDHNHDDHESHEDDNDSHQRVIFSQETDIKQNVTAEEAPTDDTWLDGYPVILEETEKGDSTPERVRPEDTARGTVVRTTDRPNEVEVGRPVPYTSLPEVPASSTTEPALAQGGEEEMLTGFIPTAAPSQPSDSPSHSDTLDYDTQQAAPTHSWQDDLSQHPFLDHGPVPPMQDSDSGVTEEHTVHILPGETGERGEVEGELGEAICTGENCPPSSSSQGPTVAAIIVAVCAIATAMIVGVWCYCHKQKKSSMYEMNGKGQSQSRQGQQIEMQQKV